MSDNNQDRSQDEGQSGVDRETEQRNRENETGKQGSEQLAPGQNQQFGQSASGESPSDQDRGSSAFGQQGQSAGGDTTLSERTGQTGGQASTGQGSSGEGGFVGSQGDQSSDYLTKGEQNQDFAAEGQGAQDSDAGRSDIETGQSQDNQPDLDDGSDSNR
jgi:hypothetical protein